MAYKHAAVAATVIGLASSLSACSMSPHYKETTSADALVAKNIEESLRKIERTQAELVQAGGIERNAGLSNQVYFDNQSVNFEWYGDGFTAVQQLASQRGYRFYSTGVRLPIPVAVNVKSVSYTALLQRLQTQISYRASIDVDHSRREISLRFTQPNARGSDPRATLSTVGQPYSGAKPLFNAAQIGQSGSLARTAPVDATKGLARPELSTNILHEFRSGGAKAQPLNIAVQQIIPQGWSADISPAIVNKYKSRKFSWVGNDWWPQVLDTTIRGTDLHYTTDIKSKKVLISDKALSSPKLSSLTPQGDAKTLSGPGNANNSGLFKSNASSVVVSTKPIGKEWIASSGTTLKESIVKWAGQAKCSRGGDWVVMWPTVVDYRIEAPVSFNGTFEEAIVKMFDLYRAAEKPLFVLANNNQCVISVDDKPQNP